ncbi:MAG: hypothetical protein J1E28_07580 [Helicobacter sp.]|nr:hypothetical protein [Helicobacter sp.]
MFAFVCGYLALYLSPGHTKRVALWWELFGRDSFYTLGDIWAMSIGEKIRHLSITYARFAGNFGLFLIVPMLFVVYKHKTKKLYAFALILGVILCSVAFKNHKHFLPFISSVVGLVWVAIVAMFYVGFAWFYHKRAEWDMYRLFIKLILAFVLFCLFVGTTIQVGLPSRAKLCYVLIEMMMIYFVFVQWISLLKENLKQRVKKVIVALCCGYGIFVLSAYIDGRVKWEQMLESIAAQKAQGLEDIKVSHKTFTSFYAQYGDWGNPSKNPNVWPNTSYAHYFGVRSFVVE